MILVKPSFEILEIMGVYGSAGIGSDALELIEKAGRICYKSEDAITSESSKEFTRLRIKQGHESIIEHSAMTVKFICDRGVTHELVRHRLCAFSQESTRYVNYKGGCTFVIPPWILIFEGEWNLEKIYQMRNDEDMELFNKPEFFWINELLNCEECYQDLLKAGWTPQQARSVLPNSTKTEIVMTANFREWRHIFELRTSSKAHPQMQEIMRPLLDECKKLIPVIFDDIAY
jgi:thymidylate synthase (FAD)